MPYAVPEDVRKALRPDDDTSSATAASLSDGQLNDAIAEATAEVDAKVKGTPYPDGSVPSLVATITRDIAAYLATLAYRKGNPLSPDAPVRLRYERAEEILNQAAKGQVELPDTPSGPVASRASVHNPYEGDLFTLSGLGIGPAPLDPWMR